MERDTKGRRGTARERDTSEGLRERDTEGD